MKRSMSRVGKACRRRDVTTIARWEFFPGEWPNITASLEHVRKLNRIQCMSESISRAKSMEQESGEELEGKEESEPESCQSFTKYNNNTAKSSLIKIKYLVCLRCTRIKMNAQKKKTAKCRNVQMFRLQS